MKTKNLKLIASSNEDLKVISAHLQDSIVSPLEVQNLLGDSGIGSIVALLRFECLSTLIASNVGWVRSM